MENGKGEFYGFSSYVGLRVGFNHYPSDPPIRRSWCLMKDPVFTTGNNIFVGVIKKDFAKKDVTKHSTPRLSKNQALSLNPDKC